MLRRVSCFYSVHLALFVVFAISGQEWLLAIEILLGAEPFTSLCYRLAVPFLQHPALNPKFLWNPQGMPLSHVQQFRNSEV